MSSITLTHSQVSYLVDRLGEPDEVFDAVCTAYGRAAAWQLGRSWLLAVTAGDQTIYSVVDHVCDLAGALEEACEPADHLDWLVNRANVRGIDAVQPASGDEPGPFYILCTRHYYGHQDMTAAVTDCAGLPREFASYEEAAQYIASIDGDEYRLVHGECARPEYAIVAM